MYKDFFLLGRICNRDIYFFKSAKNTQYNQKVFYAWQNKKNIHFFNSAKKTSIFKEVFLLGRIKRYLFLQICKEDQGYLLFKECFMLGRKIKNKAFWAISYSLLQSQKSTKAAALVALVVMTPLHCKKLVLHYSPQHLLQVGGQSSGE